MMRRESADLVLSASWIIPVEPAGSILEGHAIAIRDGTIAALGPAAEIDSGHAPKERVHLDGHALVPGFVNAHTHAAMTLFRGLADDLPLDAWLAEHIWPAEARFVDAAFVGAGTRLAVAEMLRGGTTCFNDMYFFPDVVGEVARPAGMRAVLGLIVLEVPTVWAPDRASYFARGLEVHDAFRGDDLVATALAPHAPYTVGDEAFERIRGLSESLDLPVHVHLHETEHEIEEAVRETGERPLARLDRLGLVNPRLAAVHMTHLLAEEIDKLAARGASVLHCPESNLKLASGVCPVPRLVAAGVNVALGTDGAASNNDLDMLGEMRTAALLGKLEARDATANPAERMLRMATLGGARSLGLGNRIGSLVPGKSADAAAIDLRGPDTQPVYDAVSQIVYAATRSHVREVWVAGRRVVRDGVLETLDAEEAVREAGEWRARIR
ncbi:MAG: TRZ/ATZ family hydrolase [Immundisolibacterales bacterium]|nr:TRZ/ATZ family hydrolase [Immundisolibacterales bacterium]